MENLQKRKKEIIVQINENELKQLKFSKLLKLLQSEIQESMNYWTIRQIHKMVNEVFEINVSAPFFYKFCSDLKKDEKLESRKIDKKEKIGVSQTRDTEKVQLKVAQIKELKDDGQLKVADKSEFK